MPPAAKINLKDKYEDGEIDLSMLDLMDVPVKEIATYKKAHSLDLSNNHLTVLPKTFTQLINITKLDLSKNELIELPETFGDLSRLKHLDLYKNQLKHLPLSFSKLKTLKWLDLKDNPLVPAIAAAAGPCLDSKQCQQCAKDIVQFYTKLEEKIEEERDNRERQRQKNLLANELAQQKQKQQEKKNKKKEKTKQKQQNLQEANSHANSYGLSTKKLTGKNKKESNYKKSEAKSSGLCTLLFKFLFLSLLTVLAALFILTSVQYEHTKFIENKAVQFWNDTVEKLPPSLKDYGLRAGVVIEYLHTETGVLVVKLGVILVEFKDNSPACKRLIELYNYTFEHVTDLYRNVFYDNKVK